MKNRTEMVKNRLGRQKQPWVEEAVHLIFGAGEVFETYVNRKHRPYDITQRGIAILHSIVLNNGKLSQKRIPKILNRSKQAVAGVLTNLESKHLITREEVGQDRRQRLVRITKEGLRIAEECLPLREQFYECVIANLDKNDAIHLSAILKKLISGLSIELKKSAKVRRTEDSV